jgi:hypothetical protein
MMSPDGSEYRLLCISGNLLLAGSTYGVDTDLSSAKTVDAEEEVVMVAAVPELEGHLLSEETSKVFIPEHREVLLCIYCVHDAVHMMVLLCI